MIMNNYAHHWGAALLALMLLGSQAGIGQTLSLVTPTVRPAAVLNLPQRGQLLEAALESLKQKHQVKFGYDEALVQGKRITVAVSSDLPLARQLKTLLSPLGLQYKKLDETHYVIQPKEKSTTKLQKVRRQSLGTSPAGASASTMPMVSALASRTPIYYTSTGRKNHYGYGERRRNRRRPTGSQRAGKKHDRRYRYRR